MNVNKMRVASLLHINWSFKTEASEESEVLLLFYSVGLFWTVLFCGLLCQLTGLFFNMGADPSYF